jgi:hypothetical protein
LLRSKPQRFYFIPPFICPALRHGKKKPAVHTDFVPPFPMNNSTLPYEVRAVNLLSQAIHDALRKAEAKRERLCPCGALRVWNHADKAWLCESCSEF